MTKSIIEVRRNKKNQCFLDMTDELYKALLNCARTSQKGRRGLSSKKNRVRNKIVRAEINLAIKRGIALEKAKGNCD